MRLPQKQMQFVCCVVIFVFLTQTSSSSPLADDVDNQKVVAANATDPLKGSQKSVKKDLEKVKLPLDSTTQKTKESHEKEEEVVLIGGKSSATSSATQNTGSLKQEQHANEQQATGAVASQTQSKETELKTNNASMNELSSATDNRSSSSNSVSSSAASSSLPSVYFHQEETIMQNNEEISDSLKTGFYFFVALSLSAVLFIIFKVYRYNLLA